MKKTFLKLACIATVVASMVVNNVVAQNEIDVYSWPEKSRKVEFSVHLGLRNMPVGHLAEQDLMTLDGYKPILYDEQTDRYSGGASRLLHLNFGAKLKFNLKSTYGWGIIVTADRFLINGYYTNVIPNDSYRVSNGGRKIYKNTPVMLGLNHDYYINRNVSIWGEVAVGANYRSISDRYMYIEILSDNAQEEAKWSYDNDYKYDYVYKEEFEKALSFAFQISSGIKFYNFSLGLHYYNLGWAPIKGQYSIYYYPSTDGVQYYNNKENIVVNNPLEYPLLKLSMFVLRLGYHF